ncbi:hypothetical protein ACFSQQ_11065 [Mesorhizobium kowhaii]|uniref:hypothetical protein n=1 Tax=Mesorhizobium kowhaii TaxID=1300272 RepID=UPI0035E5DC94
MLIFRNLQDHLLDLSERVPADKHFIPSIARKAHRVPFAEAMSQFAGFGPPKTPSQDRRPQSFPPRKAPLPKRTSRRCG